MPEITEFLANHEFDDSLFHQLAASGLNCEGRRFTECPFRNMRLQRRLFLGLALLGVHIYPMQSVARQTGKLQIAAGDVRRLQAGRHRFFGLRFIDVVRQLWQDAR